MARHGGSRHHGRTHQQGAAGGGALAALEVAVAGTGADLAAFKAAGWRIRAIAVLGQNGGGVRSPNLMQFAQAPIAPINQTARAVRAHFGWE